MEYDESPVHRDQYLHLHPPHSPHSIAELGEVLQQLIAEPRNASG